MRSIIGKNTGFVLLVAFVLMMSFGAAFSAQMMTEDGMMHHCPFMGVTAICEMSPLAHLAEWQQMFSATVQHLNMSALLLLLSLAIAWHFCRDLFVLKRAEKFVPRYRYREAFSDPLRRAFARGLIHSKAY